MESSWTKVRQVVANRVLTRHLNDLHDQEVAMEKAHEHQKRKVERELRATRNRTGSLQTTSTADSLFPGTSRRQSLPLPTKVSTISPRSRRGSDDAGVYMMTSDSPDLIQSDTQPHANLEDSAGNILDLMSSTLQSAARSSEEQQRNKHAPRGSTAKPGRATSGTHTRGRGDRPLAASTKSQRGQQAAMDISPRLERGESFIKTDQSQILSFDGDLSASLDTSTTDATSGKGGKLKRKQKKKKKGGVNMTEEQKTADNTHSGAKHARPSKGQVNVDFYDEDTGLKKEDGGFTPRDLSLPLHMLREEDEEDEEMDDYNNDAIEEEGEEEMALADEETAGVEEGDPWGEVKKCQYIRGYNPPTMRMPKEDSVKFVFGENGQT